MLQFMLYHIGLLMSIKIYKKHMKTPLDCTLKEFNYSLTLNQ